MALRSENCCFLFQFYIKPQLNERISAVKERCFLFQFYIKPQRESSCRRQHYVVSYFNSTSNHNDRSRLLHIKELFLISILHQTTTGNAQVYGNAWLFLISILHQTTTTEAPVPSASMLFLISILHQTTTEDPVSVNIVWLFLISILHQTTTVNNKLSEREKLFLISILHQTTTSDMRFVDCHSVMWPNERYERRMTGRGSRNDAGFVFQRYFSLKVECTSRARNRYMFAK